MTINEFHDILSQVNITWRYDHVEKGTALPYGVYTFYRDSLLNADNKTFAKKNVVEVNVYALNKAQLDEICEQVEKGFEDNDIPWSAVESYSLDESFYLNTYNMEV